MKMKLVVSGKRSSSFCASVGFCAKSLASEPRGFNESGWVIPTTDPRSILMVWAKHDTSFWRYLEFLGWALPCFMPAAGISYGHRSALAFPIVSERDFEQFCHALCTLVVGYRGVEEASQRDVRMNIFHHTLMLAGMCMEHGFELGHHYYKAKVPPRVALAFLQEHEPEQWARWSGLLETVWGT